jgi:hypothetical protein
MKVGNMRRLLKVTTGVLKRLNVLVAKVFRFLVKINGRSRSPKADFDQRL